MIQILALDDDDDDCYILTQILKDLFKEQISLICTMNQANFLAQLAQLDQPPGLILLDYHLHPNNAIQLIPHIKTLVNLDQIPLIVWSALATQQEQVDCLTEGAREFLSKEAGVEQLSQQLAQLFFRYFPHLSQPADAQ